MNSRYVFFLMKETNWKPMEFEGHADQLGKLCEEMESLGIESFQQLVGKKLCPFIDFLFPLQFPLPGIFCSSYLEFDVAIMAINS